MQEITEQADGFTVRVQGQTPDPLRASFARQASKIVIDLPEVQTSSLADKRIKSTHQLIIESRRMVDEFISRLGVHVGDSPTRDHGEVLTANDNGHSHHIAIVISSLNVGTVRSQILYPNNLCADAGIEIDSTKTALVYLYHTAERLVITGIPRKPLYVSDWLVFQVVDLLQNSALQCQNPPATPRLGPPEHPNASSNRQISESTTNVVGSDSLSFLIAPTTTAPFTHS